MAAGLDPEPEVVLADVQSQPALEVHRHNFPRPTSSRNVASLEPELLERLEADFPFSPWRTSWFSRDPKRIILGVKAWPEPATAIHWN